MGQQEAFSEAVFIFEGGEIAAEMLYADFEAYLTGKDRLESFAASRVSGMYVVIGVGLSIRSVVCFSINVDEDGLLDQSFSIPLRHLATVAGAGPDLGSGPIRLACRSQCPVSWHAHNLWEPEGEGEAHPLSQAQGAVRRNRLGYDKPAAQSKTDELDFDLIGDVLDDSFDDLFDVPATNADPPAEPTPPTLDPPNPVPPNPVPPSPAPPSQDSPNPAPPRVPTTPSGGAPNGNGGVANGRSSPELDDDPFRRHSQSMLQRKIERTFGDEGTVSLQKLIIQHSEQLDSLTAKYRRDLEQQQQVYLNQIRGCRDEIQKLKSELRHEQNRNTRLQQLLRGER